MRDHVFLKVMPKRGVVKFGKEESYRGTREGRYGFLPIGITSKFIECSCGIPCLHALEVYSRSDS